MNCCSGLHILYVRESHLSIASLSITITHYCSQTLLCFLSISVFLFTTLPQYSLSPQQYTCLHFLHKCSCAVYFPNFCASIISHSILSFILVHVSMHFVPALRGKLDNGIKCCLYVLCAGFALLIPYSVPCIRLLIVTCTLIYTRAHPKFK